MDTDFDFNVASDSDWTLIEPSLPAPPLARPNHSHVPRIASGYKLSTDGTPSSGNYSKVVGHGHSLNHAVQQVLHWSGLHTRASRRVGSLPVPAIEPSH